MQTNLPEGNGDWSLRHIGRGLPLFTVFFLWGFGSGAVQLARPLFAFEVSDSVFLVSLMVSITASSRIVSSPLTGYLTDRFGRKPLVMFGAGLRGAGSLGLFFVDSYIAFIVLEFIAQAGVSIFQTSVSVLVSDVTTRENRGRFLAMRTLSTRFGHIAGPATAGLITTMFQLRHVFFFDAMTKFSIVIIVFLMVRETIPVQEREQKRKGEAPAGPRFNLKPFANPTFLALGASAIATTMLQQGVVYSVLPVHALDQVGMSAAELGTMISIASLVTVFIAYPNGLISDRLGRKYSLVPGLLILAAGMVLLGFSPTYWAIAFAIAALGAGEGMTMGTTQAFVMDLAPTYARGTFLGIWSLVRSVASVAVPLMIGGLYASFGPQPAFLTVGVWMAFSATLVVMIARETGGRPRQEVA
jgi:MFS family permease